MVNTGHVQKPKAIMSHGIGKISFQPKLDGLVKSPLDAKYSQI